MTRKDIHRAHIHAGNGQNDLEGHTQNFRKTEEERNQTRTLFPMSVKTGPRFRHTSLFHAPQSAHRQTTVRIGLIAENAGRVALKRQNSNRVFKQEYRPTRQRGEKGEKSRQRSQKGVLTKEEKGTLPGVTGR